MCNKINTFLTTHNSFLNPNHTCLSTIYLLPPNTQTAVADTGASGTFLMPTDEHKNVKALIKHIPITQPNGDIMYATQSCDLDYPDLPHKARMGYIVPALKNHSLISVRQLCAAGCQVLFTDKCCNVIY